MIFERDFFAVLFSTRVCGENQSVERTVLILDGGRHEGRRQYYGFIMKEPGHMSKSHVSRFYDTTVTESFGQIKTSDLGYSQYKASSQLL